MGASLLALAKSIYYLNWITTKQESKQIDIYCKTWGDKKRPYLHKTIYHMEK